MQGRMQGRMQGSCVSAAPLSDQPGKYARTRCPVLKPLRTLTTHVVGKVSDFFLKASSGRQTLRRGCNPLSADAEGQRMRRWMATQQCVCPMGDPFIGRTQGWLSHRFSSCRLRSSDHGADTAISRIYAAWASSAPFHEFNIS